MSKGNSYKVPANSERVRLHLAGGSMVGWYGLYAHLKNQFQSKSWKERCNAIRILSDGWQLTYSEAEAILSGDVKCAEVTDDNVLKVEFNVYESK